ncbi:tetratricopeptide repeat protein [Tenacibaculum agarivorans]|uniref:tetratricopeptide repeat protein n=1 Tax=Tenacibaculum agarivorans TaxID=1908389 RepID=UPI00094B7D95|nr:hypothetical protein [Tenacibaculum agarivorans]
MNSRIRLLFRIVFFLVITQKINAQKNIFEKDSTEFEKEFVKAKHIFEKDYTKAKDYFTNAIPTLDTLIKKYPDKIYFKNRKADVLNRLSIASIYEGEFDKAFKLLSKSIKFKKDYGDPDDNAYSYYLMGIIWVRQGEYEKSKICYDSAYAMTQRNILKGKSVHSFKATILNLYGSHYANMDSFPKAEYYFKKAIKFVDSLGDKNIGAINRMQYAEVLSDNGRHREALKLREKAYKNYIQLGFKAAEMNALSEIATSYSLLGNHNKAYILKRQFINYLKSTGQKDRLMREYPYFLDILEKNKRFEEGFRVHKDHAILRDSLRNAEKYKELADLDAKLKYEVQKSIDSVTIVADRMVIEERQAKQANTKFWSVVTLLLIISGIMIFFYFKKAIKVKEHAYQNILLNNKIATKTEEINELLTETMQHIKSKERIADNLQKLSNEKEGITLKNIIADLKANKADNAKLMLIKQNIEQANFEFIKKIKKLHPDLTKTDIEICSLIRIGLSRKEVASIRNTSLEAVKSSRFRLKRKLNLTSNQDLDQYINSL